MLHLSKLRTFLTSKKKQKKTLASNCNHLNFVSFASSNMNKTKFTFVLFLHKFERNSFRADEKGISNSCTYPKHDK